MFVMLFLILIIKVIKCNGKGNYFEIATAKPYRAWFPKLAIEGKAVSKGWNNEINNNKTEIIEYNENFDTENLYISLKNGEEQHKRVTFMKMQDNITNQNKYKFLGVFQLYKFENGKAFYKRISTEFKIVSK